MSVGNAGAIRAGLAFVELYLDDKRLRAGLTGVTGTLKSFSRGVTALGVAATAAGGAITGTLGASITTFASMGDQLEKMSIRTGMSVEQLSLLGYAAAQSDASLEDIQTSAKHMATFLQTAGHAGGEAAQHLENLGLSLEELKRLHPDELFAKLGKAIAGANLHDFDRNAAAVAIFGRGGLSLIPMLKELDALTEQGRKRGMIISAEDAKNAVELGDAWSDLVRTFKVAAFHVGAALGPTLKDGIDTTQAIATASLEWLKVNRDIAKTVALIGLGLTGVGGTILLIKAGILLGIVTPLTTVLAAIGTILYQIGALDTGLNAAKGGFARLLDEFAPAYQGAVKAIKHGELQLAWDLMIAQMNLSFHEGTMSWIKDVKEAFKQLRVGFIEMNRFLELHGLDAHKVQDIKSAAGFYGDVLSGKSPKEAFERAATDVTEFKKNNPKATKDDINAFYDAQIAAMNRRPTVWQADTSMHSSGKPNYPQGGYWREMKPGEDADMARNRLADLKAQLDALPPLSETIRAKMPVPELLDQTKTSALGTFSGATAAMQFGSQDRMVSEQQQTNGLLRQIRDRGGLTFE